MRKRVWVLYKSHLNGEFYICRDTKTPLKELEKLSHFEGVFETYTNALDRAVEILKSKINGLEYQIKALQKTEKEAWRFE